MMLIFYTTIPPVWRCSESLVKVARHLAGLENMSNRYRNCMVIHTGHADNNEIFVCIIFDLFLFNKPVSRYSAQFQTIISKMDRPIIGLFIFRTCSAVWSLLATWLDALLFRASTQVGPIHGHNYKRWQIILPSSSGRAWPLSARKIRVKYDMLPYYRLPRLPRLPMPGVTEQCRSNCLLHWPRLFTCALFHA